MKRYQLVSLALLVASLFFIWFIPEEESPDALKPLFELNVEDLKEIRFKDDMQHYVVLRVPPKGGIKTRLLKARVYDLNGKDSTKTEKDTFKHEFFVGNLSRKYVQRFGLYEL